jgi:2-polyprenyl-3-methyl-5-hydroxy-6-metoxy-1,4-benzoquinol methylase
LSAGLESVVCNLCAGQSTSPFARRGGLEVVQCVGCGLVYVNPRFNAEAVLQHYNSGQSSRIQYYVDVEAADRRSFAEVLDAAERLRPGRGRVLDIGPNIGTSLALAQERGWKAQGVEINEEAARYCRERRGLEVLSGTLEEDTYPPSSFDLVLMADVIEHLRDPLRMLRKVARILKPGGIVMISTPNIAGWAGRLLQIKPEEHLYYFTPATMTAMLEEARLEILRNQALDRYHNLTAMVHSTTCGSLFQVLAPLFRLAHRFLGDVIVKLPLRENLLAIARKPAGGAGVVGTP